MTARKSISKKTEKPRATRSTSQPTLRKTAIESELRAERTRIPLDVKTTVLAEAGYRCAVPTCRNLLILDLHHMHQVAFGGGDTAANLIALCPTCHALYHRGGMSTAAMYLYKAMLITITGAFDHEAIDKLLFLDSQKHDAIIVSGDGLLAFSRLIAAGLAQFQQKANNNFQIVTYSINITNKGHMVLTAWRKGNLSELEKAIVPPPR